MPDNLCDTCFHCLPIEGNLDSCVCTKDGGLGKFMDKVFYCEHHETKEEHVYTLEETSRMLLEFCNDLTDEIIFYNAMNKVPPEEDYVWFAKRYRELADMMKEHGVVL